MKIGHALRWREGRATSTRELYQITGNRAVSPFDHGTHRNALRAARKEADERIRFAQLGRNSPTLDGRQMICGRGVDEWHEVRLPPSSFRAPRSGFPRFQWLTDLSTAPRIKCAPSPDRGIDNSALSAQMDLTLVSRIKF